MTQGTSGPGSPQLYDAGEEKWPVKIHAGCGSIYLEGYTNVDALGHLTTKRPDLVEINLATIDDYYAQKSSYTDIHHIAPRGEYVADVLDDLLHHSLRLREKSVNKIVCVQTFEHLLAEDGELLLSNWYRAMHRDSVLILSVPDVAATVEMLLDEETRDFATQHLAGTRKDEYSYHRTHYTAQTLELLLDAYGFSVKFLDNFHRYPALVARAVKV